MNPRDNDKALREEMNISDFPIARVGRRDKRQVIVHEEWIGKKNRRLHQKWEVAAGAKVGLPTEFAERVLVCLITFAHDQGFNRQTVFTIYRICKTLRIDTGQKSYEMVKHALYQLQGVSIYSQEAFYSKAKGKRITTEKAFGLIDILWLRHVQDDLTEELEGENGYIRWNDVFLENMRAGYIKQIDADTYFSLTSPLARTLYKLLDKQMHYRDTWEIDIFTLASRLGMVQYKYPSKVIEKLTPAFDELKTHSFLSRVEIVKRGKYTRVVFTKANRDGWDAVADPSLFETADDTEDSDTNPSDGRETAQTGENASEVVTGQNDPWSAFYDVYGASEEHQSTWAQVLKALSMSMPRSTFEQYIERTQLLTIEQGEAVVVVLHAESKDWLENRMGNKILKALNGQLEEKVQSIQFVSLKELSSICG